MISVLSIMLATLISFIAFVGSFGAQGTVDWDNEAYEQAVNGRFPILREVSGGRAIPPRIEVTWDPIFEEAWAALEQANGFDMAQAANLMPDAFHYVRWQTAALPRLYNGVGDWLLDLSMEYHAQDNTMMKTITRVAGVMVKMPIGMHFAAEPMEDDPDDYEFVAYFNYTDGSKVHVKTGTTYNTRTGRLGSDGGFGNLGFNYFVHDSLMDTTNDSWQRSLGYTSLYDVLFLQSTDVADIETIRLKFRYDGKDWMVQLWKGRYGNMPGGEVGLYNKPRYRLVDFYDTATDDERIGMSFKITDKRNGNVLIDSPLAIHWWKTSFAVYHTPLTAENLTLETVLAPTDDAMLSALKGALDKEKAKGLLSYTEMDTQFGPAVHIVW